MSRQPRPRTPAEPVWLTRLSAPVKIQVLERMKAAGFEGEPDAWIADLLTTARHSPQGYVLRLHPPKVATTPAPEQLELLATSFEVTALH